MTLLRSTCSIVASTLLLFSFAPFPVFAKPGNGGGGPFGGFAGGGNVVQGWSRGSRGDAGTNSFGGFRRGKRDRRGMGSDSFGWQNNLNGNGGHRQRHRNNYHSDFGGVGNQTGRHGHKHGGRGSNWNGGGGPNWNGGGGPNWNGGGGPNWNGGGGPNWNGGGGPNWNGGGGPNWNGGGRGRGKHKNKGNNYGQWRSAQQHMLNSQGLRGQDRADAQHWLNGGQ